MKTSSVRLFVFCFIISIPLSVLAGGLNAADSDISAAGSSCRGLVARIAEATREDYGFKDRSFLPVVISSAGWLIGSQAAFHPHEMLAPHFLKITLWSDPLLTGLTTWVVMKGGKLADLLTGKTFGPRYEALTTIASNMLIGIAWIHGSWAATGVSLSPMKSCLAVGLCGVVYPSLYFLQTKIFKRIPKAKDRSLLNYLRSSKSFGAAFAEVERAIEARAAELQIPANQVDELKITVLEAVLMEDLRATKKGQSIDLGGGFTRDTSREFLVELRKRLSQKKRWVWFFAQVNSFFAVAVAGQFLNSLNKYAANH